MSEKQELYYPYGNTDRFVVADIAAYYQEDIDKYNEVVKKDKLSYEDIAGASMSLTGTPHEETLRDFALSMIMIEVALMKRLVYGFEWRNAVHIACARNQYEICRELMFAKGNDRTASGHKHLQAIRKQNKDQNVGDYLGMIMDELENDNLSEEDFHVLLEDLAAILVEWRELDVPKIRNKKAYDIMYRMLDIFLEHKAYHTVLILSGVLYNADQSKELDRLATSMYIAGKALYGLGYMEAAKRCLALADNESDSECWLDGDEKYIDLLQTEVKLELPKEIIEIQRRRDEEVASGKVRLYTEEEVDQYMEGKLDLPLMKKKELSKRRKQQGEAALRLLESAVGDSFAERMKAIDEAFASFTEAPKLYSEAVVLYCRKAQLFAESGDIVKALEEYRMAYHCENGSCDREVLLGIADTLDKLGREKEATAYLFRAFIMFGKDVVIEKVGKKRWSAVEAYINTPTKENNRARIFTVAKPAAEYFGKKQLYFAYNNGEFRQTNQIELIQENIDSYYNPRSVRRKAYDLADIFYFASEGIDINEFATAVGIYVVSSQNGNYYTSWHEFAHIAWRWCDFEFCREYALRLLIEQGKSIVKRSNKEFLALCEENEEQNIADIMDIIFEELHLLNNFNEDTCSDVLEAFAKPVAEWRSITVPKFMNERAYEVMYEIVEKCFDRKLYKTALHLSGLLFVLDKDKAEYMKNLDRTDWLLGRLMYEMGYMASAKMCFDKADSRTRGACWEGADSKYKALMQQDVKIELTDEVYRKQEELDQGILSGAVTAYTGNQVRKHRLGIEKVTFPDEKKIAKARAKVGEKAVKLYEKSAMDTSKESIDAIESAFAVFTEAHEVYPEAAYLYFKKGNIYLDKGDLEAAYDCFMKAYNCKDGKRNGMVLLGLAIVLSQMGRMKESTAYLFRTYIMCGKGFVIDKVGEKPWKMVEAYL